MYINIIEKALRLSASEPFLLHAFLILPFDYVLCNIWEYIHQKQVPLINLQSPSLFWSFTFVCVYVAYLLKEEPLA